MAMSSNPHSQIDIEQKWLRCQKSNEPAPPLGPDWILELGEDLALLHPNEGAWYFFDSVHGEWSPTGIGVGEAILLTAEGVTGAKRIPGTSEAKASLTQRIDDLADWCFLLKRGELLGPLQQTAIPEGLDDTTQVWSPRSSRWLPFPEFRRGNPQVPPSQSASRLQESSDRFCTQCGNRTHSGDRFCRGCGKEIP